MQTPPSSPPKPSSPDVLKASIASMATVSNISVDIPLQQDDNVMKRQEQRPQSVMSYHGSANESDSDSAYKNSKERGKPDPSPPPSPNKTPLKAVSDVCSRGGHMRTVSNGLLDIQPLALPNIGDTFSIPGEKGMSNSDCKNDTMELLIEANVQNPDLKNICMVNVNIDDQNDTWAFIKRSSAQNHVGVQVSVHRDNSNNCFLSSHQNPVFIWVHLCICRTT